MITEVFEVFPEISHFDFMQLLVVKRVFFLKFSFLFLHKLF